MPKKAQAKTAAFEPQERLRPLRDQVVLRAIDADRHSGLVVIDKSRKALRGEVVAVGPGAYRKKYWLNEQGERCKVGELPGREPTELKVGQTVELLAIRPLELQIGGEPHYLCKEGDIAGVLE